jgi:hypothetical protein
MQCDLDIEITSWRLTMSVKGIESTFLRYPKNDGRELSAEGKATLHAIGQPVRAELTFHQSRSTQSTELDLDGFGFLHKSEGPSGLLGLEIDLSATLWSEVWELAKKGTPSILSIHAFGPCSPKSKPIELIYGTPPLIEPSPTYLLSGPRIRFYVDAKPVSRS